MSVSPIPSGYHAVTPYLVISGADAAIEFYKAAFGATEALRLNGAGGKVAHAEIEIGDSRLMLADEWPDMGIVGPDPQRRTPVGFCLYVSDVDAVFDRAVQLGATVDRPVAVQFYGDRSGTVRDPYGHLWTIATHVEDVTQEEVQRRFDAMMAEQGG